MYDIVGSGTSNEHLQMVFQLIDMDGNGIVGRDEIAMLFQRFGMLASRDEVDNALEHVCRTNPSTTPGPNNAFNFDDFEAYCRKFDNFM